MSRSQKADMGRSLYPITLGSGITLKGLGEGDVAEFWRFVRENRADLERYDPFVRRLRTKGDVRRSLACIEALRNQGKSLTCGLWDGEVLIGFLNGGITEERSLRVGYGLAEAYQGRGIMTQAARILITYAFEVLCLRYAWLTCWITNERSIRLAERLGFGRDATVLPADESEGHEIERLRYTLINPRFEHSG